MTDVTTDLVITDVRPWGADPVDLSISGGVITAITPTGSRAALEATAGRVEGGGRIVVPSFCDAHVHLDSTRLGLPFRPHTGGRTLVDQIMNDRRHWRSAEASVAERATFTLGRAIATGTTRARSYAQIDTDCQLERFDGVAAAREAHAEHADVVIIAFPQAGVIRDPGTADLLGAALRSGADIIGGIDPCALDQDPRGQLDIVFGLAEAHHAPIDIHLHEPGELGLFSIDLILERTEALSMQGRVTISHAFTLGGSPAEQVEPVLDRIAALDVALTTVAPTPERRLPLHAITGRGIRIGLGQDGQRDYWSPYGNGDMVDRIWQLAWTNGFRHDRDIELCVQIASIGGRQVQEPAAGRTPLDLPPTIVVGDRADLVLLPGDTLTAAVMDRPDERTVLRAGRVVAENGQPT